MPEVDPSSDEFSCVDHAGPVSDVMLCLRTSSRPLVDVQARSPGRTRNPSGPVAEPSPTLEISRVESFCTQSVSVPVAEAPRSTLASDWSSLLHPANARADKSIIGITVFFTAQGWHRARVMAVSHGPPLEGV